MAVELEFQKRSMLGYAINDSMLMIKRSTTHIVRNTDQLLGAFFQPIMFLLLFAAVFGGSIEKALPPGVSYINFLMAGIIVQTVAFGSTTTAVAVTDDLKKGIVDRFRSLPMSNLAVLNGHVISDIFRNTISMTVMIIAGFAVGFRPQANFVEWLQIIGILLIFTLAFSWMSAIIGVMAKSVEAVQWLTFVLVFPLTFASSAFAPTEGMSKYLKVFAENQPITEVIEAIRALILGNPIGDHGWKAVAWSLLILIIAVPLASRMFKNKTNN
ncbi:ABC transporter permease [Candidatus Saccharibacteria bacterium]|nr:ABC transporter permease [Candidatus Saccharibacteria bacterium]